MRIEAFDPAADPAAARGCYELYAAGLPIDDPNGPPMSEPIFRAWLTKGWSGEPRETALATGQDGAWAGAYLLELPNRDNRHLGELTVWVPPGERKRGRGTGLLRHAARAAAGHGRTLLSGFTRRGAPGSAFAAAMGSRAGVLEVRRVLDLADIPAARLAGIRRRAEDAAAGYSLLRWSGPTPEEHLPGVAAVVVAMADAPRDPGREAHREDPERLRDGDRRSAEIGIRTYSVAARYDRTGELAAITQIGMDPWEPHWGFQLVTAVTREHRGHRLGLLVKAAMLDMLISAEPEVRHILTGNAGSNQHMIAINAELGFRILDEWQSWELDVASVSGDPG